jgi:hypothetical protein
MKIAPVVIPIVAGLALALGFGGRASADPTPEPTPTPIVNFNGSPLQQPGDENVDYSNVPDDPNAPCGVVDGVLMRIQPDGFFPCTPAPAAATAANPVRAQRHPVFVAAPAAPVTPDGSQVLVQLEITLDILL